MFRSSQTRLNDFNPRTPRGVRPQSKIPPLIRLGISIHAPREGCDIFGSIQTKAKFPISIHAPREGCDVSDSCVFNIIVNFNPRTPRGVRPKINSVYGLKLDNFNPRTPRGVRPHNPVYPVFFDFISIHAPREGCDRKFLVRLG